MTAQQERPAGSAADAPPGPTMEDLAQAVDTAVAAVAELPAEHRATAEALREALDNLNKAALTTMVRGLRDDARGRELLFELVDDPVVRLAMLVHGIIRAPEPEPEPEPAPPPTSQAFIPLGDITVRGADSGWVDAAAVDEIPPGELLARTLTDHGISEDVIIVNLGGRFTSYLNVCAHEGLPLDEALIDATEGTLTCPWHALCYDATDGNCMSLPGAALESRQLRLEGNRIWVRLPG